MNKLEKIFEKTWWKSMSEIFLLLLVFFLPFGTRLQFDSEWSMYGGAFNEYLTYFFYFTDVLLLLLLLFWVVDMMVKFSKFGDWDDWKISPWTALALILMFALTFWGFYSSIWSQIPAISIYKAFRFLGMFGFLSYLVLGVKDNIKLWKKVLLVFVASVLVQSVWGIMQYYFQHDFGFWWLGESILSPMVEGVAKVDVGAEKFIRAYGVMPHANIFGFLMWIGFVVSIVNYHFSYIVFSKKRILNSVFWGIILGIIGLGILVSFSRLTWLVSVIVCLGYGIQWYINRLNYRKNKENTNKNYFWVTALVFVVIMTVGAVCNQEAVFVRSNPDISNDISVETRAIYGEASDLMITDAYYSGWGMGNFVYVLPYFSKNLQSWMYQPVHNLYKLVWSELGVFGFLALSLSMLALLFVILFGERRMKWFFISVWIGMIVLQLFDHYMWDVWQGVLLFGLLLGLLLNENWQIYYMKTKKR